jgi:hypothetical protein
MSGGGSIITRLDQAVVYLVDSTLAAWKGTTKDTKSTKGEKRGEKRGRK